MELRIWQRVEYTNIVSELQHMNVMSNDQKVILSDQINTSLRNHPWIGTMDNGLVSSLHQVLEQSEQRN